MANEKTTQTKQVKEWQPNEKQKAFLGVLSEDKYISLKQASALVGFDIATGSINSLGASGKGLVKTKEKAVKYTAHVVETRVYADGATLVIEKDVEKAETGYKLAKAE